LLGDSLVGCDEIIGDSDRLLDSSSNDEADDKDGDKDDDENIIETPIVFNFNNKRSTDNKDDESNNGKKNKI
jgi:hypothetical protein